MEATPRLPMLSFDLKHSPVGFFRFGPALEEYIKRHYGEDPKLYEKAFAELDQLREGTDVVCDYVVCTTLKKYYAQLQFLQGRFPMREGEEAAMVFTWEDAQTGKYHEGDIKFEQACILYNIGSVHSQLGVLDTRQNAEGMKVSCTHFQCAAWAFEHLRDNFGSSSMSTDLSFELLSFHILLMLAQAQECILEKSMLDGRKNNITAKVAAQVVEFYRQSIAAIDLSDSKNQINSRMHKEWRRRMNVKMAFYQCITYYYQGKQSEEAEKHGECLAYFTGAKDKLAEVAKLAKNEVPEISECLKYCQDVVMGKYNSAKKDNDFVYHDKVPDLDSLPEIKGASLVKGIPFNPNDKEISGPDIFQKLVPMEAHEASSVYSEEKAKLLRKVKGDVEQKGTELDQFMSSLQLDMDQLMPKPDTMPEHLIEKCAAMSVRTDAIQDLTDSMAAVSGLATEVELGINETQELIDNDITKTEQFEEQYGRKKPSNVLKSLLSDLTGYKEKHNEGSQLNTALHRAMNKHTTNLRTLTLPPSEILTQLPPSQPKLSPEEDSVMSDVRRLLMKVNEMREQRKGLLDKLTEQLHGDDITNALVTQDSTDKDQLYADQLKKHDTLVQHINMNLSAQDKILRSLTDANARFALIRQSFTRAEAEREKFVQELILSYEKYEDLLAKSAKGSDYNKKLLDNVNKTLERCRNECRVRHEEREMLITTFAPKVSAPSRPSAPKPGTGIGGGGGGAIGGMGVGVGGVPVGPSPMAPPQPLSQPLDLTDPSGVQTLGPDVLSTYPTSLSSMPGATTTNLPSTFEGPKLKDYLPFMKPRSFGPKTSGGGGTTSSSSPDIITQQPPLPLSPSVPPESPQPHNPGDIDANLAGILPASIAQYIASSVAPSMSFPKTNSNYSHMKNQPFPTNSSSAGASAGSMPISSGQYSSYSTSSTTTSTSTAMGNYPNTGYSNIPPGGYQVPPPQQQQQHQHQQQQHQLPPTSGSPHRGPLPTGSHLQYNNTNPASSHPPPHLQQQQLPHHHLQQQQQQQQQHHQQMRQPQPPPTPLPNPMIPPSNQPGGVPMGNYPRMPHPGSNTNAANPMMPLHPSNNQQHQQLPNQPPLQPPSSQTFHTNVSASFPVAGVSSNSINAASTTYPMASQPGSNNYYQQQPGVGYNNMGQAAPTRPGVTNTVSASDRPVLSSGKNVVAQTASTTTTNPLTPQQQPYTAYQQQQQQQQQPPVHPNQYYPQQQQHQQNQIPPNLQQQQGQYPQHPQLTQRPPQTQSPLPTSTPSAATPTPIQQSYQNIPPTSVQQTQRQQPQQQLPPSPQPPQQHQQLPPGHQYRNQQQPPQQPPRSPAHNTQVQGQQQQPHHPQQQTTNPSYGYNNMTQITHNANNQQFLPGQQPNTPTPQPYPVQQQQQQVNTHQFPGQQTIPNQQYYNQTTPNQQQTPGGNNNVHQNQNQHYPPPPNQNATNQPRFPAVNPPHSSYLPPNPNTPPITGAPNPLHPLHPQMQPPQNPAISTAHHHPSPHGSPIKMNNNTSTNIQPNMAPPTTYTQSQPLHPAYPQKQPGQQQPQLYQHPQQQQQFPGQSQQHHLYQQQQPKPPTNSTTTTNTTAPIMPPAGQTGSAAANIQQQQQRMPVSPQTHQTLPQYNPTPTATNTMNNAIYQQQQVLPPHLQQQQQQQQTPYHQQQQQLPQQQLGLYNPTQQAQMINPNQPNMSAVYVSPTPGIAQPLQPQPAPKPIQQPTLQIQPMLPQQQQQLPRPVTPTTAGHPPQRQQSVPPSSPAPAPASPQVIVPQSPATSATPPINISRQTSSLDDILSSSPNCVTDSLPIRPKVLTDQERQLEKEQAMKNQSDVVAKEPYGTQTALHKLLSDVEAFGGMVEGLSTAILGVSRLDAIWKSLLDSQESNNKKQSIAIARCYPMKNRDPDIMPYDETRVVLSSTKDDYINASWLNDLSPSCPKFINTQSPLHQTSVEFWTMVYEQGTEVLVQITSEYETGKKFPVYYPTEREKPVEQGPLVLSLQSVKFRQNWVERIVYLKNNVTKQGRTVVHLQFKGWPVSGFPDDVTSIVHFISEVHNFYKQQRTLTKPIIVHCGTGVGRSGVLVLVYAAIQELVHGNGLVDIPGLSKRLLHKRKGILVHKEQLYCAYQCLLCFAEEYLSKRGILVKTPHFSPASSSTSSSSSSLMSKDNTSKKTHSREGSLTNHPASHVVDDIVFGTVDIETIRANVGLLHVKDDKQQPSSSPSLSTSGKNTAENNVNTVGSDGSSSADYPPSMSSLPDVVQQYNSGGDGGQGISNTPLPPSDSSSVIAPSSSDKGGDPKTAKDSEAIKTSLAQLQDPSTFTLGSPEKQRPRITKANFNQEEGRLLTTVGGGSVGSGGGGGGSGGEEGDDPLASLNPLWSLGK